MDTTAVDAVLQACGTFECMESVCCIWNLDTRPRSLRIRLRSAAGIQQEQSAQEIYE